MTALNAQGITIELIMGSPLLVSSSDNPDLLLVQLDLGDY